MDTSAAKHIELVFDDEMKTFSPWSSSPKCNKYKTRMGKFKSLPLMALASFPGSGNSWTRYLIEGATGVFTGSVYSDRGMNSKGFYGEKVSESSGRTLVQKTHGYTVGSNSNPTWDDREKMVELFGRKAVIVIRNPYEAMLSYRNYARTGGDQTGHAADKVFVGKEWDSWVTKNARLWRDFYVDWLNMTTSAHVIFYENLKNNPIEEMRKFLRFVGLPENEGRLSCIEKYPKGQLKRKSLEKQVFHHRDVFSAELHVLIDSAIDTVREALAARHFEPPPLDRYKYYRSPQNRTGP